MPTATTKLLISLFGLASLSLLPISAVAIEKTNIAAKKDHTAADIMNDRDQKSNNNDNEEHMFGQNDINRFVTSIALIKHYHIKETTDEKLFNSAISGMMTKLDPHSTYLTKDDLKDLETSVSGKFVGIGVELISNDGVLKVISPLDGTPADKAGIEPGDLIIKVNGELIQNMTMREAINKIKGKKGTIVNLTILRKGEDKPLQIEITRDTIKIIAVKSKLLEPDYGYLKLSFFQGDADKEVKKALDNLQTENKKPLKGLVLDLRNNPGGLLDLSRSISDIFLDTKSTKKYNNVIVSTKGRIPDSEKILKVKSKDITNGIPIVVLINQGSASASEIVAGALQDYQRAVIMGTRSFGKGSVQTVIPISNESAIKLTTALYYTPAGHVIQAHGITPDIHVPALKIDKEDSKFLELTEADYNHHIENVGKEQLIKEKEQRKAILESEFKLAQENYQLYSALMMLKGLHVAH